MHTMLGASGIPASRLGLSASYWPGTRTVYRAVDEGVNYFFGFGIDRQMTRALRDILRNGRERFVVATGAYNYIYWHSNVRKSVERRLRALRTDYLDALMFLGVMKESEFPESVREEMLRLKEEGKARMIGISTHNREFAGRLAREGAVDLLMIRYNAAHRGAETDIFPHLAPHRPAVIGYTATRWTYLLRCPRTWPEKGRVPDAGLCYRFVLSNPSVHVCLTAPRNERQLVENLAAVRLGPLDGQDMSFMRSFGDAVHSAKQWFM